MPAHRGRSREAASLVVLSLVAFAVAAYFGLFKTLLSWVGSPERWNADELVVVVAVLGVGLGPLALYRGRQRGAEASRRSAVEEELNESAQRYQSLYDFNGDAVFSMDEHGIFTLANAAAASLTGRSVEALRGTAFADLEVAEHQPRAQRIFLSALSGQTQEALFDIVHADGHRVTIGARAMPTMVDGQVVGVQVLARNITERDRLLQELSRLSSAVDGASEGIAIADETGRVVYSNLARIRMFGYDCAADLLGKPWQVFYTEAEAARITALAGPELNSVGHWQGTTTARRADGQGVAHVLSLTVIEGGQVLSILRGITEEELAQKALKESDEHFRLVTQATRETIWDTDLASGVTTWTGAIGPMFGIAAISFQFDETWWLARIHPEDRVRITTALDDLLSSSGNTWEAEYRFRRVDHEYTTVLDRAYIVRDARGEPSRVVGSMMNITDRRRREQDLRRARLEAEEANRAKSVFLANMSHEIRTPMNGVIGMVELLLGTSLDDEQRQIVNTVSQSGDRLLAIINDILDLSKIEAGKFALEVIDFDLRDLVTETSALFSASARRKGLSYTTEVDPGIAEAYSGDPGRINQVLTNLLSNAIKFTDHGAVSLTVGCTHAHAGTGAIVFTVTDSGIGVSEKQQQLLFRPFSQADESTTRRYGGTGLGLAITRQLVEMMGGRVQFHSQGGVGSEIQVEIPLAAPAGTTPARVAPRAGAASQPRMSTRQMPPRAGLRLLLAEDNEVNQQVATMMLQRLGYLVEVAANGAEALAALERGVYAAVLMDVQMPVLDGLEATRRFRDEERAHHGSGRSASARRTPVIAMTAGALKGDREKALAAGMDDHIAKPVRLEELDDVLRRWISVQSPGAFAPSVDQTPGVHSVHEVGPTDSEAAGERTAAGVGIDHERLSMLRRLMPGGEQGPLGTLVGSFIGDSRSTVDEMTRLANSGDTDGVSKAAHRLKGAASSIGAVGVAALSAELEAPGASSRPDDLTRLLCELDREVDRIAPTLRDLISDQP